VTSAKVELNKSIEKISTSTGYVAKRNLIKFGFRFLSIIAEEPLTMVCREMTRDGLTLHHLGAKNSLIRFMKIIE